MRRPIAVLATAAASALLAAAPAHAVSQWPQFRGNSQGTGQSTATGPTRAAAVPGFPFRAAGTVSSPVVANNGTVVFGAGAYLTAVSPSGRQLWRYYGGENVNFTTAPAVSSGGTVYAIATTGTLPETPGALSESNLIALAPQGRLKWTEEVGDNVSVPDPTGVTLGPDVTIYTAGPLTSNTSSWSLQAYNGVGDLQWTAQFPGEITAPVIDPNSGNIYVAGQVVSSAGIAASGEPMTDSETLDVPSGVAAVQPGGAVVWASPVGGALGPTVGPDGTVYAAGEGIASFTSSGMLLGNTAFGEEGAAGPTTLTATGTILIPTGGGVAQVTSPTGGGTQIDVPGATQTGSTPVNDAAGNVFFGAGDVFAAASSSGRILWTARTTAALQSPAMAADGTVYVPDGRVLRAYGPGS